MNHEWKLLKVKSGNFVGHECLKCGLTIGDWRGYVNYENLDAPPLLVIDTIQVDCNWAPIPTLSIIETIQVDCEWSPTPNSLVEHEFR